MATLNDVARIAGVSISAVSKVLSDAPDTRVGAATRARILAAAEKLDYRPNFAGRALRFSRSNVIALVVPDLTNAIFVELMRGVEETALAHDYLVLLGRSDGMQPGGEAIDRLLGEGRVDGVLMQLADGSQHPVAAKGKTPIVLINSASSGGAGSVVLQDHEGAAVATRHLVERGHRRIGLIGGTASSYTAGLREAGFRHAVAEAGLELDESSITRHGYTPESGRRALRQIASLPRRPTAVFVANVNAAIGALAEARALGIRVPDELSLVAMHDAWTAENTWPPMTTVRMPLRELGRTAVEMVVERLRGGTDRLELMVADPAPQLNVRKSVAPPRGT